MKRSHGSYSKNSRNFAAHGAETVTKLMAAYSEGDRVRINANPRTKDGRPHLRFDGLAGVVKAKQGTSYVIEIKDGHKAKRIVVSNRHLVRTLSKGVI